MMVETILECSQDFGMSNGALPQWKRELLQRRAARSRPPAAPAPPPPPLPPPADETDEELRYGPGIVKRLKSRYLSLALRDAPRRRPSVLRRATSLEHLLDERPPPAPRTVPARAPRPASMAVPPAPFAPSVRRESVKRARSVDALSRLDSREELAPPSPSPPPPPPLAPRPPALRAARPPRRPTPLLRETERPPPDVVRSTLRKFESVPLRRPAPSARISAVLRGLEGSRRSLTPDREPEVRSPSPLETADALAPPTTPPPSTPAPPVPLEPTTPPSSPTPATAPSLPATAPPALPTFPTILAPPLTEANGASEPTPVAEPPSALLAASLVPTVESPSTDEPEGCVQSAALEARLVSRAALEGIARAGSTTRYAFEAPRAGSHLPPLAATNTVLVGRGARRVGVIRPMPASPRVRPESPPAPDKASPRPIEEQHPASRVEAPPTVRARTSVGLVNGHSTPEPRVVSRIGAAGIERAWSGSHVKRIDPPTPTREPEEQKAPAWSRGATRPRAPPPAATSVVFNFSNRKEVPDYIENDGLILRASRRNRIKGGESGVVVLRAEARSESESEPEESGPPSPCSVRFVNDNVLINGKSSMPPRPDRDRDRIAKLKLQFDDSLTRTFEYPSETSLCEDSPLTPAAPSTPSLPQDPPADAPATHLADNTHIASAALSRYTPHKTAPAAFQLGVTRRAPDQDPDLDHSPGAPPAHDLAPSPRASNGVACEATGAGAAEEGGGDARPCGADAARSWSEARTLATDLLF